MQQGKNAPVESAAVLLGSEALGEDLAFFEALGFGVESIYPADAPEIVELVGHGVRLRIEQGAPLSPVILRLCVPGGEPLAPPRTAPNGTRIEFVRSFDAPNLPPLAAQLTISRNADENAWGSGRAGMQYRDLIPGRVDGHFIASHIRIPQGGPVPDYVHYHDVNVQIIYCLKGWVKVVYEDQGEPFVLEAGDCVLQPSLIRHQVLESSDGLEVLEIGSPARHATRADRGMQLPTAQLRAERKFGEQVFLRHRSAQAEFVDWQVPGFSVRETGLERATAGLARLQVIRAERPAPRLQLKQPDAFRFWFVSRGSLRVTVDADAHELHAGDAIVLPTASAIELTSCSDDLEWIEFAQAQG